MRLPEPIEKRGFFWLPADPDDRLPGILRISDSGEVKLEVSGVFGDPSFVFHNMGLGSSPPANGERPNLERIVGFVEKDGPVTLDVCFRQGGSINFTGALSHSIYNAEIAFIGGDYETGEDLAFSELCLSVEGLTEWLSIIGICIRSDLEQGSGSIRYHTPEAISLRLSDEIELTFSFTIAPPSQSILTTNATVSQTSHMTLKSKAPQPIGYFSPSVFKLCNFISLAIDQPVSKNSVIGYMGQKNEFSEKSQSPVRVYYQARSHAEIKPEIRPYEILFPYEHIACQSEQTLSKWLESYEAFEPALNLYFASRSNASQYLDVRFLHLAQAAETLHRRSCQDTAMPEDEFKELCISMLEVCPQARKKWIEGKLKYANELSLRQRIKAMVKPFRSWFGNKKETESFITKVVDTRNYFTHYDSSLATKAASGEDLWKLCQKLEALFQLHLLVLVGIDPKPIVEGLVVKGYSRLGNKLKLK